MYKNKRYQIRHPQKKRTAQSLPPAALPASGLRVEGLPSSQPVTQAPLPFYILIQLSHPVNSVRISYFLFKFPSAPLIYDPHRFVPDICRLLMAFLCVKGTPVAFMLKRGDCILKYHSPSKHH